MKMKIITLNICLLVSFITYAVPVKPLVKGTFMAWDEVAKVALKISGKEMSDDAVKVTVQNLEKIAKIHGDEAARLAAKGGIEAIEKSVALAPKFTYALAKSASIPAKASITSMSAKKILATGGAVGGVVVATGGAVAMNKVANGFEAKEEATADNLRSNNDWAVGVLENPNSTPEAKEEARRILYQNHQRANVWQWPFMIIATGVTGFVILMGAGWFRRILDKSKQTSS